MSARQSTASPARARFVVTLPPSPSRLEKALAASDGAGLLTLTQTEDAFRYLAKTATRRFIVMMPFIDRIGAAWADELFSETLAEERILILRSPEQLRTSRSSGWADFASKVTRIHFYGADDSTDETFHSKIVLADGVAAYVGSANLLSRSKSKNVECGLLVEGAVVRGITIFMEALISTFDR